MPTYTSQDPVCLLRATRDQTRLWVLVPSWLATLNSLALCDFYTDDGRAAAASLLAAVTSTAPYVIPDGDSSRPTAVRFSAVATTVNIAKSWVALFRDGWDSIFSALLDCTTIPVAQDPTVAPRFFELIALSQAAITHGVGMYNYVAFETAYFLVWA